MQVDFFLPHPRLMQNRPKLTANINALAAIAPQWLPRDMGQAGFCLHDAPLEVRRGGHRIVIEGTEGANLLPELDFGASDTILVKKRYSAFFGTQLDSNLKDLDCKQIVVAGVNSHACLRATVIDAYQRDRDVLLAQDCIDSHDEQHHSVSMRYMDGKLGVAMNNEQIDAKLQKSWRRN